MCLRQPAAEEGSRRRGTKGSRIQMLELSCLLLVAFAVWMDLAAANSNPQPWRLTCGGATVSGSFTRAITSPASTLTFMGELCSSDQLQVESSAYWLCTDCLQRCPDRLDLLRGSNLVVSKQKPPASLKVGWFQMVSSANVAGPCTFVDSPMDVPEGSTEALRSFSKTSVLFVSISFIILMVISLAWLVFYYVQRFRYAHAKDRLQRRLFNAARKALARIPTRAVKAGDEELDTDCAVCLDPYQLHDIVRILPCKHVYHKSCIDPWLLEHRTCPMCKADILKYFGYQYYDGQCGRPEEMVGRVELGEREHHRSGDHRVILPEEIVSPEATSASSESNGFSFDHSENEAALAFAFTPPVAPQLVINVTNAKAFGGRVSSAGASTTSQRDIQPVTSLSARGHRTATANSAASQTEVSIMAINPQRVRSAGAGATSSGQGQIVNLVQVKTRAASSTRAATLRKESIAPQPTPIDAVVASSSSHPSV